MRAQGHGGKRAARQLKRQVRQAGKDGSGRCSWRRWIFTVSLFMIACIVSSLTAAILPLFLATFRG